MAAKTLKEAILRAGIKAEVQKALCIGPAYEIYERIEKSEAIIIEKIMNELRDFFAHQTMYSEFKGESVKDIFDEVFGDGKK